MSDSARLAAWTLAALSAVAVCAAPGRADDNGRPPSAAVAAPPRDPAVEERVRAVVLRVSSVPAADRAARSRLAAELAASYSWRDLVEVFGEVASDFRARHRGEVLLDALGRSPARGADGLWSAAAAPDADPFLRIVALRAAGGSDSLATAADVLDVALAVPADRRASPVLRVVVRDAVTSVLARRPADLAALRSRWTTFDAALRTTLLDAAEAAGPAIGTSGLCRLLDTGAPGDGEIFTRLARMPVRSSEPWAPDTEAVVQRALDAADPAVQAGAALLAGRLGGAELAEKLFLRLTDPDPRLARAAHTGLETAAGAPLVADPALWRARLDAERVWGEEQRTSVLEALRSSDASVARTAAQQLGPRRLHAAHAGPALVAALDREEPAVRVAAIASLEALRWPGAIPALLGATEDLDAQVAAAASAALGAVTGLPRCDGPAEWTAALGLRR